MDQYDSGDLIINSKSTKKFKDSDWDAYRNNSVGFIFQSYNLIGHLSIIDNVGNGNDFKWCFLWRKYKKGNGGIGQSWSKGSYAQETKPALSE